MKPKPRDHRRHLALVATRLYIEFPPNHTCLFHDRRGSAVNQTKTEQEKETHLWGQKSSLVWILSHLLTWWGGGVYGLYCATHNYTHVLSDAEPGHMI